jgi:hypothetical protein
LTARQGWRDGLGRLSPTHDSAIGQALLLILLLAVVFLAYPTLDREIYLYDEGVYLVSSKSLASGLGYRNENLPHSPPQGLYPPLLPLVLASAWRLHPDFPANLVFMKCLVLVMALGFLTSAYHCLTRVLHMTSLEAAALVAIIGLNPLFLAFATRVSSEMLFALLSMLAINSFHAFQLSGRRLDLSMSALFSALGFLTRSIGIALLLASVIVLVRQRRYRAVLSVSAIGALTAVPWFVWSWAARSAYDVYPPQIAVNYRGYVANVLLTDWMVQLHLSLPSNLRSLMGGWASLLFPWGPPVFGLLMIVVLVALARALLRHPDFHDLYCGFSLLLILLWPWPVNSRFLIVLSPLLLFYFFRAMRPSVLGTVLPTHWPQKIAGVLMAAVVLLALGHNLLSARALTEQQHDESSPAFREFHGMLAWIRDNTAPDAILTGASDPAYYLFTNRKTVRLSYPDPFLIYYRQDVPTDFADAGRLLAWLKQLNACYVLQDPLIGGKELLYYRSLIEAMKRTAPDALTPVYQDKDGSFVVYRIDRCHDRSRAIWRS